MNEKRCKQSKILISACLLVLIPVLDQLTKYLVRTLLQVGESVSVWGEFFRITYILNDGMAFGMGGGWRWVFMILTPVALTALAIVYFRFFAKLKPAKCAALVMIFAGGLSNMIDRIFFIDLDPASTGLFDGRVVDFFDFNITLFGKRIWNAVFNVADAFVVVGVFLLIVLLLIDEVKEYRRKKRTAAQPDGQTGLSAPEQAEPSEPEQAEPSEAEQTEPSEAEQTEPSEPEQTEPSEPEQTEPSEPEQVEPSEPEQTENSEPEQASPAELL